MPLWHTKLTVYFENIFIRISFRIIKVDQLKKHTL